MGWYRVSKLAWGRIRNAATASKLLPQNPLTPPTSGKIYPLSDRRKTGLFGSSLISSRFGCLNWSKSNHIPNTHFLDHAKRFYHVDRYQVYHFRPRGYSRWFENPRNVLIVVLVGCGCVITVYFGNLETIPYTKRTHFVLLSKDLERKLGESQFKSLKESYKGKILPAIHPYSVRVRLIAKDVIQALQRGISHELVWSEPNYASQEPFWNHGHGSLETLKGEKQFAMEGDWKKEGEILDDNWVKKSRKKGEARRAQPSTKHLEHVNWEVIVVDEPIVNAFCLPGGKIVVFTGLLKQFPTDAEIATVVGHEIGHAVARHVAEQITKGMWLAIIQLILYQFVMPDVVNTMSNLLLRLPFSRKMEIEADYIGLLLIASAGYDPRVAPSVYEKLGKIGGVPPALQDYLSTHPSGTRRAQLLAQAQVMQEAMDLYRERVSGRRIEGFL